MNYSMMEESQQKIALIPFLKLCFTPSKIMGAFVFLLVIELMVLWVSRPPTDHVELWVPIRKNASGSRLTKAVKKTIRSYDYSTFFEFSRSYIIPRKFLHLRIDLKRPYYWDGSIMSETTKVFAPYKVRGEGITVRSYIRHELIDLFYGRFLTLILFNFYLYMIFLIIIKYDLTRI